MSDSCSPESATASLTAVSAWAASGTSAERVTFEKPTPLTATLHRFSHIVVLLSIVRPSRQPLRGFLRMRFFLNALKEVPHPEEARSAVSKDAGFLCSSLAQSVVRAKRNCGN